MRTVQQVLLETVLIVRLLTWSWCDVSGSGILYYEVTRLEQETDYVGLQYRVRECVEFYLHASWYLALWQFCMHLICIKERQFSIRYLDWLLIAEKIVKWARTLPKTSRKLRHNTADIKTFL
jgi:hypothetical protein